MSRTLRLLATLAIALAMSACQRRDSAPLPLVEKPLSLLARTTLTGATLDVKALEGKVVMINFWSPG
jgi:hypothetical protein